MGFKDSPRIEYHYCHSYLCDLEQDVPTLSASVSPFIKEREPFRTWKGLHGTPYIMWAPIDVQILVGKRTNEYRA